MKFYLAFLLITPFFIYAQQPPKKANTIIVPGITFEKCVNTLMDIGYKLDKIDKDFKFAKTEFKQAENKKIKGWEISISIRVKDSTATITGQHRDYTSKKENTITDIRYMPGSLTMDKELFGELDTYAKRLNPVVYYEKR